ncbi:MAG TPA: porin family protein [Epsilonproteobacteria bacterium]|nr:porin family protein [Campylobacterota bacterium]
MKKTLIATALATQLFTQLHAGGHIEPVVMNEPEVVESEVAESKFYIVASGMYMFGDTVDHEGLLLDGDKDYGFGIDLGYRIGDGFAVEYDFTYGSNTVKEGTEEAQATYYTSAIDLVYVYEMTETIGVFGKVGYEYEWETIDDYNIDGTDHNFVFGAGVEIAMNEKYKFVAEYEHSLIESPHGDSIFAGVMYNF